jgi:hypothetical protein
MDAIRTHVRADAAPPAMNGSPPIVPSAPFDSPLDAAPQITTAPAREAVDAHAPQTTSTPAPTPTDARPTSDADGLAAPAEPSTPQRSSDDTTESIEH